MSDNVVSNPPRWAVAPYFLVDDVVATANYYRDKLGFTFERFWGEPPCFCMVARGGVVIMLSQSTTTGVMRPNPVADPEREAWDAYVWVDNADALYAEFKSRGVRIAREDLRSAIRMPRFRRRGLQRVSPRCRSRHRRMTQRSGLPAGIDVG